MRTKLLKILSALIASFVTLTAVITAEGGKPYVSASSAVLIDADSGRVIFEKNAHVKRGMASTTKIMTALVAIECGDLEGTVKIPREAVGVEGSSLYLTENEELTLRQLLYALMLRSANDAATAIAITVGGSVREFAEMMNRRAAEMGLENTHFENPHGLDAKDHYTTAYELAVITAEALKNETFRQIASTVSQALPQNGIPDRRVVVNHNRLLRSYKGCIGVKTGFTKRCGRCLVSAAERDGVTLIAVTLNAPDDWSDHARMLDHGFSEFEGVTLTAEHIKGTAAVVGGSSEGVKYSCVGELTISVRRGSDIETVIEINRFYYAPINEGDVLGRAVFYEGDEEIGSLPIVANETVPRAKVKRSFFGWLKALFYKIF